MISFTANSDYVYKYFNFENLYFFKFRPIWKISYNFNLFIILQY